MELTDDPGWGRPQDVAIAMARGGAALRTTNGLVALRTTFLAFAVALLAIGGFALFLASGAKDASVEVGTACAAVAIAGIALVVVARLVVPPLACGSPTELAGAYRSRFFLRLALADAPALLGFTGVVLAGSALPYLVGLALAAIGFLRLAPTRAHLARDQEDLNAQGCPHLLLEVLQGDLEA